MPGEAFNGNQYRLLNRPYRPGPGTSRAFYTRINDGRLYHECTALDDKCELAAVVGGPAALALVGRAGGYARSRAVRVCRERRRRSPCQSSPRTLATAYGVDDVEADYVGLVPLAKTYGTLPMHHLRRGRRRCGPASSRGAPMKNTPGEPCVHDGGAQPSGPDGSVPRPAEEKRSPRAEIGLLHVLAGADLGRGPLEHHASLLHHVDELR